MAANQEALMPGPAFVYLLRCADRSLYCGWTTDLDARLAAHRSGRGGVYTRRRGAVAYAAAWRCATRSDARRLEVRIKQLPRPAKLALVAGAELRLAAGADVLAGERVATA
jgi:putative endonuclease